jgi:hypothetical protein
VLRLGKNQGFARAFNQGVSSSDSPYVLSINPDVTTHPGFVEEMVRAISQDVRIGMAAPKLVRTDDPRILDSTGLFIDRSRSPYDRGQGAIDRGQYDTHVEVFGACGAAALYRRSMLDDLALNNEYFDEGFFAYYEDADLAWRAQMRGWRCIYVPRAVATHTRGWGDTLRRRGRVAKSAAGPRMALRNRYLMTIHNDALSRFLSDAPRILAAELPRLTFAAVTRPGVLLGLWDLLRSWPTAMRKRRQIRSRQVVGDASLRSWFLNAAQPTETTAR